MTRHGRNYEGVLWELPPEAQPDVEDPGLKAERRKREFAKAKEEQEGRLFEDPFYLQQYNIDWDDNLDNKNESVENGAFLTAANENYLQKVQ